MLVDALIAAAVTVGIFALLHALLCRPEEPEPVEEPAAVAERESVSVG